MADKKISALTTAVVPLAGTEVLPIVQNGATVKTSVASVTENRSSIGMGTPPSGWETATQFPTDFAYAGGINTDVGYNFVLSRNAYYNGGWKQKAGTGVGNPQLFVIAADGTYSWSSATVTPNANDPISWTTLASLTTTGYTLNNGNFIQGTAAKGVNFTANTPAAGMTSQLLNWYEEGTFTPNQGGGLTVVGAFSSVGTYTRIGRQVTVNFSFSGATSIAAAAGGNLCTNLPFTALNVNVNCSGAMTNAAFTANGACLVERGFKNAWAATTITATSTISCSITYFV